MIKDIKFGFQIMKYGLNFKACMIGLAFCMGVGLLFSILLPVGAIGCLYAGMGVLFTVQLIHSVSVSTMVQTSPHKQRIQTLIPTVIGTLCLLITNTFAVIAQWMGHQRAINNTNPNLIIVYEPGEYETGYIISSLVLVYMLLYTAFAMKHFGVAMVILIGGCIAIQNLDQLGKIDYVMIPEGLAIVLSYVIVLFGGFIMYVISCLSYKKDYSKATFDNLLKRAK